MPSRPGRSLTKCSVPTPTDALAQWNAAGLPIDRAFTGIDMVLVLGAQEPAARAAVDEARELFTKLKARRLIEILDAAMTATPMAPTGRSGTGAKAGLSGADTAGADTSAVDEPVI